MGLLLVCLFLWEILNYCKSGSLFTNNAIIHDIDILSLDHLDVVEASFWLLLWEVLNDGQCGATRLVFFSTLSEGGKCSESFIVVISINICVNLSCNKSNVFLWFIFLRLLTDVSLKLYLFLGLGCLHRGRGKDGRLCQD
jgi:hypothetical protein